MKTLYKKLIKQSLAFVLFCSLQPALRAQSGAALNFDGSDDYVQVPSLSFGNNWTAEAWIRPTSLFGNWNSVLGQCYYDGSSGFVLAVQSGSVFVDSPLGGNISVGITTGVWVHVAVTYNNGIYALYKNGILAGVATASFTNSSNPFYIGTRTNNTNVGLVDPYQGDIDEVRIWSVTRSQCEIQQYMNCEIPGSATGLTANYHFNQGTASGINTLVLNLNDDAGSNTGTLHDFGLLLLSSTSNWIAPGGVTSSFFTPASASTSEIDVTGNSVAITDGDNSPSAADHTDFNGAATRTFVILNTGTQTLNVGTPVFTGPGASQFTVITPPSTLLTAGTGTTSFVVAFTPASLGIKTATLTIYNLDCSEPYYDFAITATAIAGSALDFDGVDDYVELSANLAELGKGDFTIESWIRTTGVNEGIVLFTDVDAVWEIGEKALYLDASGMPTFVGFGNNYIHSNLAVNDGLWHHIALTWDYTGGTSGTARFYIDGADHTGSVGYSANNNNGPGGFKLGRPNFMAGEAPNYFSGSMDEVRIWNRALCLPEIMNNLHCEVPSPASQTGLNGYYNFNGGIAIGVNPTMTVATDGATFTNDGILTNFALTGFSSNWSAPGGVTSGSSCAVYQDNEINIRGNNVTIVNGDVTPALTDYTDFGSVGVGSILSRTFVIYNTGTLPLSITGYNLTGADAGSFTITTNPAASVASLGTTSIVISFSAAALGLKTASLTITSSDCDEPNSIFVVQATGTPAGEALNFDGVGDYINIPDPNFGTGDFSIETWINPAATGGYILSSRSSEQGPGGYWWSLGYGSGNIAVELADAQVASSYTVFSTPAMITNGTWNHVALVRAGKEMSLYVNGILANRFTESFIRDFTKGVNNLNAGAWANNGAAFYNGSMDELRLWTVARTQCEIQTYMNCEIPGTASNLVGNYHFNQGAASLANPTQTIVTDGSASVRTGTLLGFSLTGSTSNWVAPGGVNTGSTTINTPTVEIDVRGNGNSIIDGNTSTSAVDFTDFNGVLTRTFTIYNTIAGGVLNTYTPYINGTNASEFIVSTVPSTAIAGIGSTDFVVTLVPGSSGVKTATINIPNNDCNEPVYDFVITATAIAGAGLNFDGINDNATVASGINLNNQSFSIEFWAKRGVNGTNGLVVGQGSSISMNQSLQLGFRNSNHFTFAFYLNDMNYLGPQTTDGNFHHWACVYDATAVGKNRFIYCDGVLVLSDFSASAFTGTGPFIIGDAGYGSNPYNGTVDELRIWNKALTQCEIQTYMNCEIAGSQPSLTANYHFNQGIAGGANTGLTNLIDDTTTPENATLNNFALTGLTSNFIIPGGVTSGSTTPNPPAVILAIEGNGNAIAAGSSTPLLSNFTDFGTATTRTLVMRNIGTGPLYINNGLFSGADAANFSVTTTPSSVIPTSGSSNFVITFTPTALGSQSAILTINSSDCTSPNYSFVVTASTSAASALDFDGTDHVSVPYNSAFALTSAFSVEFWVKLNTITGDQELLAKGTDDAANGHFGFLFTNGYPKFTIFQGGFNNAYSTTNALSPGVWTHVAGTWNGTTMSLYINGLLVATQPLTGPISLNTGDLQIGWLGKLPSFPYPTNGKFDEVRIWDVARTQCEIQSYMNCEIPTTASNLVANYHFNQGLPSLSNSTVTTLTDAANGYNGMLNGFTLNGSTSNWVVPGGVVSGSVTPGIPTASILVSGNSNSITPGSTSISTSNFTDFGGLSTSTFVIQNSATGTLNISVPYFTGVNASEFSVTVLPALSLTTSATTSFVVAFTPTTSGFRTATLSIDNNDCNTPIFSCAIGGTPATASALNFDGSDDYIACPASMVSSLASGIVSGEAWVNMSAWTPYESILKNWGETPGVTGAFHFGAAISSNNIEIYITQSNGSVVSVSDPTPLSTGLWYHLAFVADGSQLHLYKNGIEVGTPVNYDGTLKTSQPGVFIGCKSNDLGTAPSSTLGSYWNGSMDEIRLWNVARSQCEIQSYMNCEIPAGASGLLANYHFNQGAAGLSNATETLLTDAAATNSGTLNSFNLNGTTSNWVNPGGVSSGSVTPAVITSSLIVLGNSNTITPGSTATSTNNFTDFGTALARTFVAQNPGTGTLYINNIFFSGANASDFSVTVLPSSTLGTNGTGNFVVTFSPSTLGTQSAVLNVYSSDCSYPAYSFVITATTLPAAALSFDGTDDYVDLGASALLKPTAAVTAEAWVYRSAWSNADQTFVSNTENNGYALLTRAASGNLEACLRRNNSWAVVGTPVSAITPGWHHVAFTYDGRYTILYMDGVQKGVDDAGAIYPVDYNSANSTLIGAEASTGSTPEPGWYLNGNIDEVKIWDRALCQSEIQNNLNCEVSVTGNGLLANYHFNQGVASGSNPTATVLTDASGNSNDGTLSLFLLSGGNSNWTTPGAVTSGSSCSVFTSPEIDLVGNAVSIPAGGATPTLTNGTDFGNISLSGITVNTFTLQNTGNNTLSVSTITVSGPDAASFSVSLLSPASPVAQGSFAVFSIAFVPSASGIKTATVTINNNDCDESAYDFAVTGTSDNGAAFSFDGVDDYVNCGNILTASYSKEAWIRLGSSPNGNNLISSGSSVSGSAFWAPGIATYDLSAGHDGNWYQVQDPAPLVLGTWYHVAVTYDAPSKTMNLYKNGALVASSTTVDPFTGTNPLQIGAFSGTFVANGAMDEVRIWNRALCPAEIVNNMNCEIAATAPGLIANYHFNQGIGFGPNATNTSVIDASGASNDGTLVGTALSGSVSNWQSASAVVSGSACPVIAIPEIDLVGNGLSIVDGSTVSSLSDHTDFGSVCINTLVVRTYTVQNTGGANLTVSTITTTGADAALFSVGALSPAPPILPGGSAVFSITFTPTSSGTKTAAITLTSNDCNESPYDFVITGTCNALPVVTATTTNSTICNGAATLLNGIGADTYTWTGGTPTVTDGVSFTPSATLTYTVIGTDVLTGCTSTNLATQLITVNPTPTVTAAANTNVVCNGTSLTLTPANAATYTLNPGGTAATSFTLIPSANTIYSITGTDINGCVSTNTATVSVTVNPLPVVTATASDPVICSTGTTALTGGGADTYVWSGGAINNASFTPTGTTSYTVTGTYTLTGCTSTNLAVQTITVNAVPNVTITATSTVICAGNTATLTAGGADTYTWNPGNFSGTVFTPSPASLTSYTLAGTNTAGCTSTNLATQSINVNATPNVGAASSGSVICAGRTITVNGSGADTYTWTNGATDGVPFIPTASGDYSVTGTSTAGCTSTNVAVVSVTVNALPSLTISATHSVICLGGQTALSGSGALSYTWSGGIADNAVFSPTATTSYTVTGKDANACESNAVATITVNNLPDLLVASSSGTSCEAESVTLTVSGASSYTWNTSETTANIVVSPTATGTYTVNAIDVNTCTNSVSYTQSVTPCPGAFTAYTTSKNVSCSRKNDGEIAVISSNSYTNPVLTYVWSPATLCPGNNCDSLKNLPSGTYSLTLKITYTVNGTLVKTDSLVLDPVTLTDLTGECDIKVFSGITANNDGVNDVMIIENIEEFPSNSVTVFNRWGQEVFKTKGYNNKDKAWPQKEDISDLPSNTYFYIVDLGNGGGIFKGWVELIKN